jgi:dihydroxyacid dehydratase/phosphogluconate dehydratase
MDARAFDKPKLPSRHDGLLRGDCIAATGRTLKQNLENVKFIENQKVVLPVSNAISRTGGVVGQGSLAPDGAIVKVAGMKTLQVRGAARAFDCEEDCSRAVENRSYRDGHIIAIDAVKGTLDLEVDAAELDKRRKAWKAPANPYQSGVLRKYADQVGSARKGAVTPCRRKG